MRALSVLLREARHGLASTSDSAALDAEILLAHTLSVPRHFLYAEQDTSLTVDQEKYFFELLQRRIKGEPIAYITGHREFWSLDFKVTRDTLIPRPETELLVDLVLNYSSDSKKVVADLGTGSGAIALAIAHERPAWDIHATDISQAALDVAIDNAKRLHIPNVTFHQGHWCEALPAIVFDVIVSNPPYIAEEDRNLAENVRHFEPSSALISADEGLYDLTYIIKQAKKYLAPQGLLFLEHGFSQAEAVQTRLKEAGYVKVKSFCDLAGLERVTVGEIG